MFQEPDSQFRRRIANAFEGQGEQWLADLPDIMSEAKKKFGLTQVEPFGELSYNYTARANKNDGQEFVLKLGVPTDEFLHELNALRFMKGHGIVQVVDHDGKSGMILLELCSPGKTLATVKDDLRATEIAIDIMQQLWQSKPTDYSFPTTIDWYERIEVIESVDAKLTQYAIGLCQELHQSMGEQVLLHGDLHHFNILSAERQPWLAIDPKGVIGEREFEVGALLRNPIPDIATTMDTKKVLANRVDLMVERLGFDRQKMIAWSFVQAVFAAIWCYRIGDDMWQPLQHCAQVLSHDVV